MRPQSSPQHAFLRPDLLRPNFLGPDLLEPNHLRSNLVGPRPVEPSRFGPRLVGPNRVLVFSAIVSFGKRTIAGRRPDEKRPQRCGHGRGLSTHNKAGRLSGVRSQKMRLTVVF